MGQRAIPFSFTGNRPPDSGAAKRAISSVFYRHPQLRQVGNDWWVDYFNTVGGRTSAMLQVGWAGNVEPAWPALTSIYQVAAAQMGSQVRFDTSALPTPTGPSPSTGPTGYTGWSPYDVPRPPASMPGLPPQPAFRLPAITLPGMGGQGAPRDGGGFGLQNLSPWLLAALAALAVGIAWRMSR